MTINVVLIAVSIIFHRRGRFIPRKLLFLVFSSKFIPAPRTQPPGQRFHFRAVPLTIRVSRNSSIQSPVSKRRRNLISLLIGALLSMGATPASAQFAAVQPCPADLQPGFDSITTEQIQSLVSVLAGPHFEGRGTGQKGYKKAAHWVAGKLAEYGVEPIYSDGGYFQSVPLQQKVPIIEECYIRAAGGITIKAQGNIGFDTYSSKPSVLGNLIFVRCPNGRFKIPPSVILRDSIVIYWADDSVLKYASQKIESHQPAAMLRVVNGSPQSINQPTFATQVPMAIKGNISATAVDRLLAGSGLKPIGEDVAPPAEIEIMDPRSSVSLANPVRLRRIEAPNVIGVIPGSEPSLRHEHIVIGSHLDHIGITSGGVYRGADDNGSGCSAVLSIAKALTANKVRPKRSVMFIFFAAEEIGLVGSNYYCQRPVLPLKDITCMLNVDMVGRNESSAKETADENEGSIHLIGARQGGNTLHDVILDANRHVGFRFELDEEAIFDRSDQYNFFRKGVGTAFLFGGFHPDYHQPTDRIDRLNFKKIQAAARLYYLTIFKADEHGPFPVAVQRREKLQPLQNPK